MSRSVVLPAMVALSLFVAAPALAKTTIQKGQRLCKDAAESVQPPFQSVRVDTDDTRASNTVLVFSLRVVTADGATQKITCTVNRETDGVALDGVGATQQQGAAPAISSPPLALAPSTADADYPEQVRSLAALPPDAREAGFGTLRQTAAEAQSGGDYAAAVVILEALSGAGDARSKLALAHLYRDGLGVAQDSPAHVRLLTEAAGQGLVEAQVELGDILSSGTGAPEDLAAARSWYSKAAAQGDASAAAKLEALAQPAADEQTAAPSDMSEVSAADPAPAQAGSSSGLSSFLTLLAVAVVGVFSVWYLLATKVFIPTAKCPRCRGKMTPVSRNRHHSSTFQKRLPSAIDTVEAGTDRWTYVCNSCKTTTVRSRRYKKVIDRNMLD